MNWFKKSSENKRTAVSLNDRGLSIVNPYILKKTKQKKMLNFKMSFCQLQVYYGRRKTVE